MSKSKVEKKVTVKVEKKVAPVVETKLSWENWQAAQLANLKMQLEYLRSDGRSDGDLDVVAVLKKIEEAEKVGEG